MGIFLAALIAVAVLLLTAAPGFIFVKTKVFKEEAIPIFSKLLFSISSSSLLIYQ